MLHERNYEQTFDLIRAAIARVFWSRYLCYGWLRLIASADKSWYSGV